MEFPSPGGFSATFVVIPVVIGVVFLLILGFIIFRVVRGARQWKRNNASPVLTVDARVVAKREDVQTYHHDMASDVNHMHHISSSTTYYATFEVASGDRMEFEVRDTEYGMLAENDAGRLTFQGTRYLGFERGRNPSA